MGNFLFDNPSEHLEASCFLKWSIFKNYYEAFYISVQSCSKLFLQESAQVKLPPTLENLSEMSDSEWVLTALRNTSKAAPAYTLPSPW